MEGIERTPGIRPRPSLGRRLDAWARACLPVTGTILLMLLTAAPFGLGEQAEMLPAVTLTSVWFWSLFRPAAMPPPVVFMLGLLVDLLGYNPVGVSILTLLIAHGLALRLRRRLAQQGFLAIWAVFLPVAAGAAALVWALSSALMVRLLPGSPALFQAALTMAVYPGLAIVFARAHERVADPNQA